MRHFLILTALIAAGSCGPRVNGAIAQACVDAGRSSSSPELCSCVGSVASQTLSRSDQARVVTFFEEPERANDIKIDDSTSADAFWERYRRFTDTAERSCR